MPDDLAAPLPNLPYQQYENAAKALKGNDRFGPDLGPVGIAKILPQLGVPPPVTAVRRTPYVFFYAEDQNLFDLSALLRGEVPAPAARARMLALAVLTGERHYLAGAELELLLSVPAERWIDVAPLDHALVDQLVRKGLLLSDADERPLKVLRERDEAISANEWNLFAAFYHYMTQWSGAEMARDEDGNPLLGEHARVAIEAFIADHGPPPAEFAPPRSSEAVPLPGAEREGGLYRALTARRTTRAFDPQEPMTLEQLDTVLRYVFGCSRLRHDVHQSRVHQTHQCVGGRASSDRGVSDHQQRRRRCAGYLSVQRP